MRDISETYFEIKDGVNFIRVEVVKQNFPNAELDWDKNSVNCWVTVKFGLFSGKINTDLLTINFDIFKNELEILYKTLDQEATFEGYEDQVTIQIEGDGIGHLQAQCWLIDCNGNELKGELNFDQTELPKLIEQLENITKEFKVFGEIIEKDVSNNSLWQRVKIKFNL